MSRLLLIGLGLIVGVAVLILLGVNMYVQSQGTQARIQQELSQRLGTTLRIRRISVTPWWGLKLTGITIPQSQPGVSPDFLKAKKLSAADSVFVPVRRAARHQGDFVDQSRGRLGAECGWEMAGAIDAAGARGTRSFRRNQRRPTEVPGCCFARRGTKSRRKSLPQNQARRLLSKSRTSPRQFTPEVQRVNV